MNADLMSVAVWLATAGVGFVIGLVGLAATKRRMQEQPTQVSTSATLLSEESSVAAA